LNAFTLFLLQKKIIPVFTAPRKPWNQASIEGSNSIFSRKFWHRERYASIEMIDQRSQLFNKSYQQYHGYEPPVRGTRRKTPFVPMVHFIRKVYQDEQSKRAYIEILKKKIVLPKSYVGMFVLAQWNLNSDKLTLQYESDQQAIIVKELNFKLNPKTREIGGSLSFVT
jgi:lipopolysaccharide biosynthesis glycosyltransferase